MSESWPAPWLRQPVRPYEAGLSSANLRERLRLTLVAAGQVLAMPVALVLALLSTLAVPLGLVLIGFGMAYLVVPANARVVSAHRWVAAHLLGEPIRRRYADTAGVDLIAVPIRWLRDPARCRDVGLLWFAATGGFLLSLLPVAFLLAPVTYLTLLLTGAASLWAVLLVLIMVELVLWWFLTPVLVLARLRAEAWILVGSRVEELQARVSEVEQSRAESVDSSAAEIRRIERDLHDGPQARLAALGMNVGLAQRLLHTDPEAADALLREARESTVAALDDLRAVVRGIHPPVLTDLGLAGAVEALAMALPIPVRVSSALDRRLPPPVESAAYFALSECLANTVKHAQASAAWVRISLEPGSDHGPDRLRLAVGDDGAGGADAAGSGLAGLARRLRAFDGTMHLHSPPGGPTIVTMEVPCPS